MRKKKAYKKEKKNVFLKYVLPLVISFLGAFIFFASYNHYLLDKSMANLNIALMNIEKADTIDEIAGLKSMLDDTVIMEFAKEGKEIDVASMVDIEFSGHIISKGTMDRQKKDAKYFIETAIKRKEKKVPKIRASLDRMIVKAIPRRRKEDRKGLIGQAKHIVKRLSSYKGAELQEECLKAGKFYLRAKRFEEALKYFEKGRDAAPGASQAEMADIYIATIYKNKGDYKKATELFGRKKNKISSEMQVLSEYQKGDTLYKDAELFDSMRTFEKMFDSNPAYVVNQVSQFRVGYTYLYELKNERLAFEAFKKLQLYAPNCPLALYIEQKIIPDMARKYRRKGLKFLRDAYKYLQEGKYEEAMEQFELAIALDRNDALSRCGMGLSLFFLNKNRESVEETTLAKKLAPNDPNVIESMGFIFYAVGELGSAVEEYKKAVQLNPRSFITHYNLGTVYVLTGQMSKGIRHLRKSIDLNPAFPNSRNNIGYALWYQEEYEQALVHMEKATVLDPEYLDAFYNLGVLYYETGDFSSSRDAFLWADQLKPDYRNTRKYLVAIENKLGY